MGRGAPAKGVDFGVPPQTEEHVPLIQRSRNMDLVSTGEILWAKHFGSKLFYFYFFASKFYSVKAHEL